MEIMTTKDVMKISGLSERRVLDAAPRYAKKVGRDWIWDMEGVNKLLERKGMRGHKLS